MSVKIDSAASMKMNGNRVKIADAKSWTGPDYNDLAFDVVAQDIMVGSFKLPDRKAIFRVEPSGEETYLATVSNEYPIIKHSDIVSKLEEGMNLSNASIKTIVSKNGAQMQRIYTLNDYSVEVRPGDEISPSIRIVNSYNGATCIGFYIDAVRLVCTNGMVAIKQFMSMNYRHFGNRFNLNLFAQNAKKLTKGFDDYSRNWRKWLTEDVTQERADLIVNYMPARLRPMISSRYSENFDGTKWGLYNAYTASLTHDYIPGRAISPDTQKITLGSEVTKIFSDAWYWTAPKDEVIKDLVAKRRMKQTGEIIDVEAEVVA
jgi:hypothetical protein